MKEKIIFYGLITIIIIGTAVVFIFLALLPLELVCRYELNLFWFVLAFTWALFWSMVCFSLAYQLSLVVFWLRFCRNI